MTHPAFASDLPAAPQAALQADLAALVAARLCHDLISPIGAIGNGVELLTLDPRSSAGELALIADSVASANAKLRFFRIAFGPAARGQTISRAEVATLLSALYRTSRISPDWSSTPDIDRDDAKLAFLLMLCAEHALPTGGTLAMRGDGTSWTLRATSPRLRHDAALWSHLADTPPDALPDAAQVQFPLAAAQLSRLGRRASLDVGVSTMTVSV